LRKVIKFGGFFDRTRGEIERPDLQVESGSPFGMVMVFYDSTCPPTKKGTIKNGIVQGG